MPTKRRELERCGLKDEFKIWLFRTIFVGVDIGYKGTPRNHMPPPKVRTEQEVELLSAQYKKDTEQGRIIKVGNISPARK